MPRMFFKIVLLASVFCLSLSGMKKGFNPAAENLKRHQALLAEAEKATSFIKKMRLLEKFIESPYESMCTEPYIPRMITDLNFDLFTKMLGVLTEAAKVKKGDAETLVRQFQDFLDSRSNFPEEDTKDFTAQYGLIENRVVELTAMVSRLKIKEENKLHSKLCKEMEDKKSEQLA